MHQDKNGVVYVSNHRRARNVHCRNRHVHTCMRYGVLSRVALFIRGCIPGLCATKRGQQRYSRGLAAIMHMNAVTFHPPLFLQETEWSWGWKPTKLRNHWWNLLNPAKELFTVKRLLFSNAFCIIQGKFQVKHNSLSGTRIPGVGWHIWWGIVSD